MKHFLILLCICAFATVGKSQNTRANGDATTYAVAYVDTLTNSTAVTRTLSAYKYPYAYEINVAADSLTGSTAGVYYVEHKAYGGSLWNAVSSTTVDGSSTVTAKVTGTVLAGTIRVRATGGGTQTTRYASDINIIRITK